MRWICRFVMKKYLRVTYWNVGRISRPEKPSLPYKLKCALGHPEIHQAAYGILYGGSQELVVQARWLWALRWYVRNKRLRTNHRLIELTITGPKGVIEKLPS